MIDLDHNATTPLHPAVRAAMGELLERDALGNPSSVHRGGQAAREIVEAARREVALACGADPLGVTFTSGGTEADALAVLGAARARRAAGRAAGVLSSAIEHPAVLGAVRMLDAEGHPVAWVRLDPEGRLEPSEVAARIAADPELGVVSLSAANHELGNAYDVAAIAAAAREARPDVTIHVDAVQAFGKVPIDLRAWGVDLVSVSAHKIHGPAGVGALVHTKDAKLSALWTGGGQERGRRPGTEPTLLVHGFGVAAQHVVREREARQASVRPLRERLREGLVALGATIHGDLDQHTGNTVNAAFEGCEGQLVVMALDMLGIRISTGAACSAGTLEPSAVLLALGHSTTRAREALRLSLSATNIAADVDAVLAALPEIVARVRRAGAA